MNRDSSGPDEPFGGFAEAREAAENRFRSAASIEAAHYEANTGWCACLRQWPCSVLEACRRAQAEARGELGRLAVAANETVEIPRVKEDLPDAHHALESLRSDRERRNQRRRWF